MEFIWSWFFLSVSPQVLYEFWFRYRGRPAITEIFQKRYFGLLEGNYSKPSANIWSYLDAFLTLRAIFVSFYGLGYSIFLLMVFFFFLFPLVWNCFSFSLLGNAPQIAATGALKSHKAFDVLVLNTEWRPLSSSLASVSFDLSHPAKLRAELEGQMAFTIKDELLNSKDFFLIF